MLNIHSPYSPQEASERIDKLFQLNNLKLDTSMSIPAPDRLFAEQLKGVMAAVMYICFDFGNIPYNNITIQKGVLEKIIFSEVGRVLYDNRDCRDLGANGNHIWAVFNAPMHENINGLVETSAKVNSVIQLINHKLGNSQIFIKDGIGMDFGETYFITDRITVTGEQQDQVWLGDTFEKAHKLAVRLLDDADRPIGVTQNVFQNLRKEYQSFFEEQDSNTYKAGLINVSINNWIKEH